MTTSFLKHLKKAISLAVCLVLFACNQTQPTPPAKVKYTAYLKGDTATAVLQVSKSLFKGVLEIKYKNSFKDSGDVKGFIKGDTLMGEYHFQQYRFRPWKRNPIIFLRKGGKLIMGKGIVKYTMGIPHYNSLFPIDYTESTHFVFSKR
jgi:hypothetical protein